MTPDLLQIPFMGNHTVFLSGPPGSGKTTLAIRRLRQLLDQDVPAEQILILVPQRTLATPYYEALQGSDAPAGGKVDIATIGGLARRTLDLFWPLVAEPAGFMQPDQRPRFLTLETTQYHMDHIAETYITTGAFDGVTIPRARLVSQIIDNMNKAAAVGFPLEEIASRLGGAWQGDSALLRIYEQVQSMALAFRQSCLAENLLDWSLQIEVFWKHLLPLPLFRRYLLGGYRHLIVDNTEEDVPVAHDLLQTWLQLCESALVIHDTDGGYRVFLGADPEGALALSALCRERLVLSGSHVTSPEVTALGSELAGRFGPSATQNTAPQVDGQQAPSSPEGQSNPRDALVHPDKILRFHFEMLDWVTDEISRLVHEEGRSPGEIAVLAPFLSDSLRFSLVHRLKAHNIDIRTHRPSRELREEPEARCLLTLAKLAYPDWRRPPPRLDVAQALALSIRDLDPVRAALLSQIVYRIKDGQPTLSTFHQIKPETQQRISYLAGGRYDELRDWLQSHTDRSRSAGEEAGTEDLDHFISRLFGECLSQPGFGFHGNLNAGKTTANLIESVQKFRQSFPEPVSSLPPVLEEPMSEHPHALGGSQSATSPPVPGQPPISKERTPEQQKPLSLEYIEMVERGVVAAQYIANWTSRDKDAVLLVPAYTFLMMNQPATIQFWLNAGSNAWIERIYQPLTHPYVLRRDWPREQIWSDDDEVRVREEALRRLLLGLSRRCRERIYLAFSELDERGNEQQGPLLHAVQSLLRQQSGPSQDLENGAGGSA